MITISNRVPGRAKKIDLKLLETITAAALEELKIETAELEIVLLGAKEMASLNKIFLNHEGPTDVITFNYSEITESTMHGEIFVCVNEAERQAKEFGTTWREELVRYIVHGVLHLTGHDDLTAAPRAKMKREEERSVRKLSRRFALSRL